MAAKICTVLFLCTHNSARSILAEAILNRLGGRRFRAFSAGSFPSGKVNLLALQLLQDLGYSTGDLRSKSWDEFAAPGAPGMDIIITVCDQAAGETCPIWPGHPVTAHWGLADPSAATGSDDDRRRAFRDTYDALEHRLRTLVSLPAETLDRLALKRGLEEIGQLTAARAP